MPHVYPFKNLGPVLPPRDPEVLATEARRNQAVVGDQDQAMAVVAPQQAVVVGAPPVVVVVAAPPAVDVVHQPGVFVDDEDTETDTDDGWGEGGESDIDICEVEDDE